MKFIRHKGNLAVNYNIVLEADLHGTLKLAAGDRKISMAALVRGVLEDWAVNNTLYWKER